MKSIILALFPEIVQKTKHTTSVLDGKRLVLISRRGRGFVDTKVFKQSIGSITFI